jgi:hypothetical protein
MVKLQTLKITVSVGILHFMVDIETSLHDSWNVILRGTMKGHTILLAILHDVFSNHKHVQNLNILKASLKKFKGKILAALAIK